MLKKIDIDEVFRGKNVALYKLLPGFIFSYLKRIIHQDEINRFIEQHGAKYDFDFVKAILDEFGIQTKVIGAENIPPSGGIILAANHPLGGLDGMALIHA
ncbi:MAG: glycerol acyltransferase, partial [Bacteroidota bacterium]